MLFHLEKMIYNNGQFNGQTNSINKILGAGETNDVFISYFLAAYSRPVLRKTDPSIN